MGYFISQLTYEQLNPLLNEDSVVVLPIGGGSKEHGNHLPMGTDFYVTDYVASEVTKRCNVLTLQHCRMLISPRLLNGKDRSALNMRISRPMYRIYF